LKDGKGANSCCRQWAGKPSQCWECKGATNAYIDEIAPFRLHPRAVAYQATGGGGIAATPQCGYLSLAGY